MVEPALSTPSTCRSVCGSSSSGRTSAMKPDALVIGRMALSVARALSSVSGSSAFSMMASSCAELRPLLARHVGQRRAHRVGAEQAGHEDQRVDADGDGERQIGEAVAVLEGVPGDDEAVRLVVAVHLREADLGAQLVRLLARQAAVRQALTAKPNSASVELLRGELVAAGAVGVERLGAGLQREQGGGRLGRLLGVAVDAGHLRLGHVGGNTWRCRAASSAAAPRRGARRRAAGGTRRAPSRRPAARGRDRRAARRPRRRRSPAPCLMRCSAVSSSPLYLASSPSIVASSRSIWAMRVSAVSRRFLASFTRSSWIL